VDAHLKHIPSLGTFTVGRLSCGDLQVPGGKAYRSLDAKVLALGTIDEFGADLLEGLDIARGERDANLVDFLGGVSKLHPVGYIETVLGLRRNPFLLFGKT